MFLFIVLINNDYFRLSSAPLMEGALNRIWALIREGRLLNFLDYQGALIRIITVYTSTQIRSLLFISLKIINFFGL